MVYIVLSPEELLNWVWALWKAGYIAELFVKIIIFPGLIFLSLAVLLAVWFERKVNARIHLRVGPYHVGPVMGLFQPIADFVKLLGKEIIIPDNAHKLLFKAAPIAALTLSVLPVAFMPFGLYRPGLIPFVPDQPERYWVIYYSELSLLVIILLLTMRPFIMIAAGWASRNKFCTLGALRAAFQLLAYEIPLLIAVASVVLVVGSFDLVEIVESQEKVWFGVIQPIGFAVFFVAMLAEVARRPFDLPHAEQEVIYGWFTEYSGVLYGCFMMAEYLDLTTVSLLLTALFMGGWLGPSFLPPIFWFLFKTSIVMMIILLLRGVFPRVRIDQLLSAGWAYLIPLALIQVLITLALVQFTPTLVGV
ncbi:MAG: NADH-quinone oxidoreductase subunit NuoH [Candidatus Bathyarchaeia archaeon]